MVSLLQRLRRFDSFALGPSFVTSVGVGRSYDEGDVMTSSQLARRLDF